jgi:hypothetical protein
MIRLHISLLCGVLFLNRSGLCALLDESYHLIDAVEMRYSFASCVLDLAPPDWGDLPPVFGPDAHDKDLGAA